MIPVSTSTFSDCTILSASCTAMSGLRWSSSTTTSRFSFPAILAASMNPSRTSMPRPAPPPESVVIIPTLTLSICASAHADPALSAAMDAAAINVLNFISFSLGMAAPLAGPFR